MRIGPSGRHVALLALLGAALPRLASAQGECPAVLRQGDGVRAWCDLAVKPRLDSAAILPQYPVLLRSARVAGEVDLVLEIDSAGRVVPGFVRVLRSAHDLFTLRVRESAKTWHFTRNGHDDGAPVRLLVHAAFELARADVATRPVTEVATTETGLRIRVADRASARTDHSADAEIPFAPPARVDSLDLDAAMAAALDTVFARQSADSLRPLCLARVSAGRLPTRAVALLHVPSERTFTPDRCPRTYASAFVVLDSHGRPLPTEAAPAGHRDPLWLTVVDVKPWTADMFRIQVRTRRGTGGQEYQCDARRAASPLPWRAECVLRSTWME